MRGVTIQHKLGVLRAMRPQSYGTARAALLAAALIVTLARPVVAADRDNDRPKLPRFAILRFSDVNARRGPGTQYTVDWIYHQIGMPVEATEVFDTWYKIKDYQGSTAWVHKSQLRWQRRGMIGGEGVTLYTAPEDTAPVAARLMAKVTFDLESCDGAWCHVKGKNFTGYLQQQRFFGVQPGEKF